MAQLPNQVTKEEIIKLCKDETEEKVLSLIISSRTTPDLLKKMKLKFKNSIKDAKEIIELEGIDPSPYMKRLENININTELTKIASTKTLVIYVSPTQTKVYNLPRVIKSTPILSFQDGFLIRYLVRELNLNNEFLLLDLSQKDTNIYEVNRYKFNEYRKVNLPTKLDDVYELERKEGQHKQRYTSQGGTTFHGYGGKKEEYQEVLNSYLYVLDKEICEKLSSEKIPIMLAGTENVVSLYRTITKYPYILETAIEMNVDHLSKAQLHKETVRALKKQTDLEISKTVEKVKDKFNLGLGSNELEALHKAADEGRIENLIVKKDFKVWGGKDDTNKIKISLRKGKSDIDLVNLLMCKVVKNSGNIYIDFSDQSEYTIIGEYRY